MRTIEEKAKAYDEAIEVAQRFYNNCVAITKKGLEDIFPVLKESEDEKIRGRIIATIHLYYGEPLEDEAKEMIAWLEKQGSEQHPKFRIGDTIKYKYDNRQFTIKSVDLDKGTYTYTQEGRGNNIDYADEEFELVEQNPAWSEEDEKMLNGICMYIMCSNSPEGFTEWIDWLKSLKDRYTWKPSDEQMEALHKSLCQVGNSTAIQISKLISDLKKL